MPTPDPQHIARYVANGAVHFGHRRDGEFARLSAAPWEDGRETGERDPASAVRLPAPVAPTKITCVGLNYRAHIAESVTGAQGPPPEPLLFLKPPSAILASGDAIRYPKGVTRLDPEGELAIVIGRRARAVPR